jgi:preprotein translocase subunit SecA
MPMTTLLPETALHVPVTIVPPVTETDSRDVDYSVLPRGLRRPARDFIDRVIEFDCEDQPDEEIIARLIALSEDMTDNPNTADSHQAEVFAIVAEMAARYLGQRPYLVQHLAAYILSHDQIAEMATGEGKTLASVLAICWMALGGKPVHVMTANDYLAQRDAATMGVLYNRLGLSVGVTLTTITVAQKVEAYACDITYGTAIQFGFDHLADHLTLDPDMRVQHDHYWALVDEADSLMLDEAKTPLIISGTAPIADAQEDWAAWAAGLGEQHYDADYIKRQVWLSPHGIASAEHFTNVTNLYHHPRLASLAQAALDAQILKQRDRDYMVTEVNGVPTISIIDEATGRVLTGRRWQDGIHEAVEAKEGVPIRQPAPTLARITIPGYLDLYAHLGGMTGTAKSAEEEFAHLYDLTVVLIPRHVPSRRQDDPDVMYLTMEAKNKAIAGAVREHQRASRPVLIGTPTVEDAHNLSSVMANLGIEHSVLSARHHTAEAAVIAQAGRPGSVTVATNMAGRGVDILLGGNFELLDPELQSTLSPAQFAIDRAKVIEAGGLVVISTARHSSARIDQQLRGRSGRQGEPGLTKGYLSVQDDLLSHMKDSRLTSLVARLGAHGDQGASSKLIDNIVNDVQERYEVLHESQRKEVAKYDKVYAAQRTEIYRYRNQILDQNWRENLASWFSLADENLVLFNQEWPFIGDPVVDSTTGETIAQPSSVTESEVDLSDQVPQSPDEWDEYEATVALDAELAEKQRYVDDLDASITQAQESFIARSENTPDDMRDQVVRMLLCQTLDASWQNELVNLDALREGMGLRRTTGDPVARFGLEAYDLFARMLTRMLAIGVTKCQAVILTTTINDPAPEPVVPSE